jgi:hypothetical protein
MTDRSHKADLRSHRAAFDEAAISFGAGMFAAGEIDRCGTLKETS